MHRDKTFGLALGVLLIGVVCAFFFRNEKDVTDQPPRLRDPEKLDQQIAEKKLSPYLDKNEYEESNVPRIQEDAAGLSDGSGWSVPSFAKSPVGVSGQKFDPRNGALAGPPEPIGTRSDEEPISTSGVGRNGTQSSSGTGSRPTIMTDRTHVVQSGDTLSGISAKYLGSSQRYEEILEANPDVLRRPTDLRPKMVLRIPPRQKQVQPNRAVVSNKAQVVRTKATVVTESAGSEKRRKPASSTSSPRGRDTELSQVKVNTRKPVPPAEPGDKIETRSLEPQPVEQPDASDSEEDVASNRSRKQIATPVSKTNDEVKAGKETDELASPTGAEETPAKPKRRFFAPKRTPFIPRRDVSQRPPDDLPPWEGLKGTAVTK